MYLLLFILNGMINFKEFNSPTDACAEAKLHKSYTLLQRPNTLTMGYNLYTTTSVPPSIVAVRCVPAFTTEVITQEKSE